MTALTLHHHIHSNTTILVETTSRLLFLSNGQHSLFITTFTATPPSLWRRISRLLFQSNDSTHSSSPHSQQHHHLCGGASVDFSSSLMTALTLHHHIHSNTTILVETTSRLPFLSNRQHSLFITTFTAIPPSLWRRPVDLSSCLTDSTQSSAPHSQQYHHLCGGVPVDFSSCLTDSTHSSSPH